MLFLILLLLSLNEVLSDTRIRTFRSSGSVATGTFTDAEFSDRMRTLINGFTQPAGYCNINNPTYPISN